MSKREGRTERPTAKRLREARREGRVAMTQDLAPWVAVLAGSYTLQTTIRSVRVAVVAAFGTIDKVAATADPNDAVRGLGSALLHAMLGLSPLFLVVAASSTAAHLAQTHGVVSFKRLKPDFRHLNVLKGLQRLLSPRRWWDTAKQMAKAGIVVAVVWPRTSRLVHEVLDRRGKPIDRDLGRIGIEMLGMVRAAGWSLILLALVDYGMQRRRHQADLKMTKQEVKEELRHSEGDPQLKAKIRQIQATRSKKRMMADVKLANVVLTNPTHIAVAIRYDASVGPSPVVVAIGLGSVAQRIRAAAAEAAVPVVEAKPLARALWRSCEVGDPVPPVLYEAIARVLVFVRRIRHHSSFAGQWELPPTYQTNPAHLDAVGRLRRRRKISS